MADGTLAPVAQPSNQLLSRSDKNPPYYNKSDFQLLLSLPDKNSEMGRTREIELLSRYEKIAGRYKNTFKTLSYFYMVGCSFALDVEKNLDVDLQAVYRIIEKLVKAGFIEPVTKTRIPRKSGRKTTLYGVLDVTQREIDEAISREMRFSSKSYAFVDKLYQRTLYEVEREGIQYSKIVSLAKRQGNSGFLFIDIADQVAKKHQQNGVKVWK